MRSPARTIALALALVPILASATGCRDYEFLSPAPNLRGITIPLPPPSFADEVLIHIDLEGTVPMGFESDFTQAFVYEKGTQRGYFVVTDDSSYTVYDVLIDIDDNCIETWVMTAEGEESTRIDYKAVLLEGEACSDDSCSAPDMLGACVCLEKWQVGC